MNMSSEVERFIPKLKEVLEISPKGAVISDMRKEDEPIIYYNRKFLAMTGYNEDEVVGRNCRFLQKEDREQGGLFVLRSAIKLQQPCKVTLRNYRKNGDLFFNRLSISPIFNEDGILTHFLGLQDDVTDIISVKKELQETEKEKQILLAEVHHRVKNNLSIMSSLLELEMNQKSERDALAKSSLRIKSMALVHEMLYQKEGLAYVDMSEFVKEFAADTSLFKEGGSNLEYNFDLEKVALNINQAIPLSIILGELIDNVSRHAYPAKSAGRIDIRLRKADKYIQLEVIDYGTGLADPAIFKRPTTMGFTVVQTLLSQIDAVAELIDGNETGFGVRIKMPDSFRKGPSQSRRIDM